MNNEFIRDTGVTAKLFSKISFKLNSKFSGRRFKRYKKKGGDEERWIGREEEM